MTEDSIKKIATVIALVAGTVALITILGIMKAEPAPTLVAITAVCVTAAAWARVKAN